MYNNVCTSATVTSSDPTANLAGVNDGQLPSGHVCYGSTANTNKCAVAENSGIRWFTLDFGTEIPLSTIVFLGGKNDNTDGFAGQEKWYGPSVTYNDPTNTRIIQAGGTNFPTMIADLDDGSGPKNVRYIHWVATSGT